MLGVQSIQANISQGTGMDPGSGREVSKVHRGVLNQRLN